MKINNKAFTLIELLAVIVILAIIALIATPIVLNIIASTKESSQLRSAEMYIKGVETSIATATLNNKKVEDGTYPITKDGDICLIELTNNNTCSNKEKTLEVEMNGETPTSGSITIESGKIKDVTLNYSNSKTIVKNNEGNLVYGETEETKVWTLTKAEGNTGAKAEIGDTITIKSENFYVYSNENGYIKAIAKYNLEVGNSTNSVFPATTETNLQSPNALGFKSGYTIYATVKYSSSSNDYVGSIIEGYVKTYKTKLESMGATFVDTLDDVEDPDDQQAGSGVRLITKKELEELGCTSSYFSCSEAPSFIYETSYWCGSDNDGTSVWYVDSYGGFGYSGDYSCADSNGVRPIITILESSI